MNCLQRFLIIKRFIHDNFYDTEYRFTKWVYVCDIVTKMNSYLLMRKLSVFTIIITTHDRPLLLKRALQSLIAQTFSDFQVIIVSDSAAYIPPYEEFLALQGRYIFVLRSGIDGPAESRNMGLALAKSKYVMFLDDDDAFEPTHLESLAAAVSEQSPDILFCSFSICTEDRTKMPPEIVSFETFSIADATKDSVYVRNTIPNNCLVYRRDAIQNKINDPTMRIYEDWDFLLSCLGSCYLTYIPIYSVVIYKTISAIAEENMRRGNTRNDLVCSATLDIYKRHPAPNMDVKLSRQDFFASAGIELPLDNF